MGFDRGQDVLPENGVENKRMVQSITADRPGR
jgi:hypothetical protein